MSFLYLLLISIFFIVIGQYLKYGFKDSRFFYLIHGLGLVVISIWAVIESSNQVGGVNWPWWILAIFFSIPLVLSILFGAIQDVVKKNN